MKVKDMIEDLSRLDPETDVVVSQPLALDEKGPWWGLIDIPVMGMAVSKETHEIRFIIGKEDARKCFPPGMIKEVTFFDDPKTKTVTFGKAQAAKAVRDSRIKNGKRKARK